MTDYPECEKLSAVRDKSDLLSSFLDFMRDEGITLAKWSENGIDEDRAGPFLYSVCGGDNEKNELLAKFFGIDMKKVEAERRALLTSLQKEG